MHDILIVGQGLAGSLLAWSLLEQGLKVCIVSDEQLSASQVAAGIINPITGQRFVLAKNTPQQLAWASQFYSQIEHKLQHQFFYPTPMLRLFNNEKEQISCQKRLCDASYKPFLSSATMPQHLKAHFSGIQQHHTAYIDTKKLLSCLQQYFSQHCHIHKQPLCPKDIKHAKNSISWQGITAKKVIFCEGYRMQSNPFFSWLPLQPAHGEIISCTTTSKLAPEIINKSKWLLPIDAHTCRIGATYDPHINSPHLQQTSQQMLLDFAQSLFQQNTRFKVLQHQAGIRPTTQDKQPFIGFHPKYANIGIFNGFGSRGCLLIPWYAQQFSQTLQYQSIIPTESNITRYAQRVSPQAV